MDKEENKIKKTLIALAAVAVCLTITILAIQKRQGDILSASGTDYIKWVDYTVTAEAMKKACRLDIESYGSDIHLDWITLLAYAAVRGGGEFNKSSSKYIDEVASMLKPGDTDIKQLEEKYKYFDYYYEVYNAVLGGMLGEYEVENDDGSKTWTKKYGLKAYSPIAMGFPYQDYDDFGASRSFGYKRPHLGHDMMGQIGTPIWILSRILK